MKRKTRYLSAGMLAMAAINGSAPEAEAGGFIDNVVREVERAGRNVEREARRTRENVRRSEIGRTGHRAERSIRREKCDYNRERCRQSRSGGARSRGRGPIGQSYKAILRVYCEDNDWDAGYAELRGRSSRSMSDAKDDARRQMGSRNVCADYGNRHRVETGQTEWVHF